MKKENDITGEPIIKKKNKLKSINISEFAYEVGKFDKEFGVKLKKGNPYSEPEQIFGQAIKDAEVYINKLIMLINDIDVDEYFDEGVSCGGFAFSESGIIGHTLSELSIIDWDETDSFFMVDSEEFIRRFLTYTLALYRSKIEKMSSNKFNGDKIPFGPYEHGYFYVKKMVNDIKDLTLFMMGGEDYSNALMKVIFNLSYSKNKKDWKNYNTIVYNMVYQLKDGLKTNMVTSRFMDDDMAIYNILCLGYVLSTGCTDFAHAVPKFKHIEGATKNHDLINLLTEVGNSILLENKSHKRPPLFKQFAISQPLIASNYKDINEDWCLSICVYALSYVDFVCNDKDVHEFIQKMINK